MDLSKHQQLMLKLLRKARDADCLVTIEVLTGIEEQPVVTFTQISIDKIDEDVLDFTLKATIAPDTNAVLKSAVLLDTINRVIIISEVNGPSNLVVPRPVGRG